MHLKVVLGFFVGIKDTVVSLAILIHSPAFINFARFWAPFGITTAFKVCLLIITVPVNPLGAWGGRPVSRKGPDNLDLKRFSGYGIHSTSSKGACRSSAPRARMS
ncbi:hypothetical protein TNCV_923651 [Trichonephila clavipes]|nr:hypothetical protein TNCV_923651 [Trichonephila clavipes]